MGTGFRSIAKQEKKEGFVILDYSVNTDRIELDDIFSQ